MPAGGLAQRLFGEEIASPVLLVSVWFVRYSLFIILD